MVTTWVFKYLFISTAVIGKAVLLKWNLEAAKFYEMSNLVTSHGGLMLEFVRGKNSNFVAIFQADFNVMFLNIEENHTKGSLDQRITLW